MLSITIVIQHLILFLDLLKVATHIASLVIGGYIMIYPTVYASRYLVSSNTNNPLIQDL